MNFFKALILLFIMTSCTQKEKVDLIVSGGSVYTVDKEFTVAEAFAVKDGKVVAVGSSQKILDKYDSENLIDAEGKFVYPGFNDAHCHFNGYAVNLMQYADLRGTKSPEEIYKLLKEHHDKFGGEWILGRSWDQNDWEDTSFPDKTKLDELFPEIPVYLVRVDGHAGWCNSKALELAGISADTKVQGGEVLVKNGEPSGVLIDNAMGFVSMLIPGITQDQQEKGLLEAQNNCFAAGLTSVTDCGLDKATILLMDEMQKAGNLKIRVNAMLNPTQENFDFFVKKGKAYKTDCLLVNTIKIYADGALDQEELC